MNIHDRVASELPGFVTASGLPPEDVTTSLTLQAARETVPRLLDVMRELGHDVGVHEWAAFTHPLAHELGKLLDAYGSDKACGHNYHHLYAHILGPRRTEPLRIFEVGLGSPNLDVTGNMGAGARAGASLRAFRDFCPNAVVFGADVDKRVLFSEHHILTLFVDQTEPSTFKTAEGFGPFDFIVDDGLHSTHANLATMSFAVRTLAPRGWFIVEDILRPGALPVWHLANAMLPPDRFRGMVIRADAGFHLFAMQRVA